MEELILKSGTGELEIVVFDILNQKYAINVLKTKEIVILDNITSLPLTDKSIKGLTNVRDKIYTVIDLGYVLNQKEILNDETSLKDVKGLLCEFNNQQVIFLINDVYDIQRIKWEEVKGSEKVFDNSLVTGTILHENDIFFMLDFEKILSDRMETPYTSEKEVIDFKEKRKDIKIFLAEDSKLINSLIKNTLSKAGYNTVKDFEDGQCLLNHLTSIQKEKDTYSDIVDLIITDIEMPQLDGLTLTKNLKDNSFYKELPIVVFSSLITEDLKHKGESVGANAQVSKPNIGELVSIIDKLLHI